MPLVLVAGNQTPNPTLDPGPGASSLPVWRGSPWNSRLGNDGGTVILSRTMRRTHGHTSAGRRWRGGKAGHAGVAATEFPWQTLVSPGIRGCTSALTGFQDPYKLNSPQTL